MEVKGVTLFSLPCRWHQLSLGPHPGTQSVPIPKTTTPDTTGQPGDPAKAARYLVWCVSGLELVSVLRDELDNA